jgi:excisionase family DNA binding protein
MSHSLKPFSLLNTKEAAGLLGVEPNKVYQFAKTGNLPFIKLGRNYCYIEARVLVWKAEYEKRQAEIASTCSAKEVSALLRVSVSKVYRLVNDDRLPCLIEKKGGINRYYFKDEDIIAWLLEKEQNRPAEEQLTEMLETPEPEPPEPAARAAGAGGRAA